MDENPDNTPTVIAALERERDGYTARGLTDRAAECDAEIVRLTGGKKRGKAATEAS